MPTKLRRHAVGAAVALTLGLSALAWPAIAAPAAPAAEAPVVVLVVDAQKVREESKAGKAIQAQLQQHYQLYQQSISKQEKELMGAREELQRQQSILAQNAFQEKAKEFEQRVGEARKKAQEAERTLSAARGDALGKLDGMMIQVLGDLAKERHANLVLLKSTVLLFDTKFDVTEETIKRLDQKLPTVTVNFSPTVEHAPAAAAKSGRKKN